MKPHIHESVRDPACLRSLETEREKEVYVTFLAKDEVRQLEALEGHYRMIK